MEEFWQRLRERKLVQWALAYVAAAFALIQVLDVIAQRFGWPDQLEKLLIVALAVGFFITLVLAWYHGEKGAQRVTRRELLVLAVVLAAGGGALWHFGHVPGAAAESAGVVQTATAAPASDKSIAVLPFENLSADKDNAYFADGMQDEILTKLAKIAVLRVISRTSTKTYSSHPDNLKLIAQQLGVANVLEGSVQKAGNAVHINVRLIRAADGQQLWGESYDRTLDNIFGVEGEVAQAVADALSAKLTDAEQRVVAATGTQKPAALDAYLRGRELDNYGLTFSGSAHAIDFYQQAVREDPNYAQAWASLAEAMGSMYQNGADVHRSTPAAIRAAADTALRLQPAASESLMAQGTYLYRVQGDYPAARVFYLRALQAQPGNEDVLQDIYFIERRMGLWNDAIAHFHASIARDPRNASNLAQGAAEIFLYLRRFDDARSYLLQALKIAPEASTTNAILALLEQNLGKLDAADAWLAKVPVQSSDEYENLAVARQFRYRRRYADLIVRMAPVYRKDAADWNAADFEALISAAWAERWAGHDDRAREDFTRLANAIEARGGAASAGQMRMFRWNAPLVYAGLGDWAKADAVSRKAIEYAKGDTLESAWATMTRAIVLAQHGDRDAAIAMLPGLLAMPAGPTPPQLELDPYWDPIRNDPRFVAMSKQPISEYKIPAHE
ncbi:MAG: hypothetical protein JSS44_08070 [Proteobacteria bacterium]|nr:hypothetical protein [Pseudomonadota bacterium]MBS0463975.1 hypothetical protein [Pseudomonadota bacterium]